MDQQNILKQNLYTGLKRLGLTEMECNLYILCLHLGPSSLSTIAQHLKISRPNVYKLLHKLERQELASFSTRKKYARTFNVEPPTKILEKLRQEQEASRELDRALVSSMPDLLALYHQGDSPTKVKVLPGREQFLKLFYQTLEEEKDLIDFFGSEKDFMEFVSWEKEKAWIEERVKRGTRIRLLILPSKEVETHIVPDAREKLRDVRYLKSPFPFSTAFQLYANKMVILQPKTPLTVLIEDQHIIKMMRAVFAMLWEQSEPATA